MTEKRFVYIEHKGADYILDTPNWELDFIEMLGDTLEAEEIVNILNEQNETIIKQQKMITELEKLQSKTAKEQMKFFNGLMEAEDEIEDLKKQKQQLYRTESKLRVRIKKLEKENQSQSDAIDGLQEMMAHYNLEDLE